LRESTAGIADAPGKVRPSASTMLAIVEAVPMVMHCPALLDIHTSASIKSSRLTVPAFIPSESCQVAVPDPISFPLNFPFNIGPPGTTIVGRFTLAAPIKVEGVVLSQPVKSTIPSSGLARMVSSTSILARFRQSIVEGFMMVSPNDITGNSRGNPPASYTPRLTISANSRK
jgi:hypothetical protein